MISIIIPTFNRPDFLSRLLISIEKQTYKEFEVIVIDDYSPNNAEYDKVIKSFKSKFKEFKYLKNDSNKGAPYSRNRGIKIAKYDYLTLVDDDDEWLPNKLEKQINVFKKSNNKLGIVYTWAESVDEKGRVIYKYRSQIEGNALREIIIECFIPSPSIMVLKKAIIEAGLFDENLPSCQDWDMWTRIFIKGYSCRVVKSVETIYHKHNNDTIGTSQKASLGYYRYFTKHIRLIYQYLPLISFLKRMIYVSLIRLKQ